MSKKKPRDITPESRAAKAAAPKGRRKDLPGQQQLPVKPKIPKTMKGLLDEMNATEVRIARSKTDLVKQKGPKEEAGNAIKGLKIQLEADREHLEDCAREIRTRQADLPLTADDAKE